MFSRARRPIAAGLALEHVAAVARLAVIACLAGGLTVTVPQVIPGQELPGVVSGVPMVIPVTDKRLREPEPDNWLMYRRTYLAPA